MNFTRMMKFVQSIIKTLSQTKLISTLRDTQVVKSAVAMLQSVANTAVYKVLRNGVVWIIHNITRILIMIRNSNAMRSFRAAILAQNFTRMQLVLMAPLLISVGMFVLIVINLTLASLPAIQQFGITTLLFSTELSTPTHGMSDPTKVGLLPPLWGTVLTILVALPIAFPVALAMSIFSTEFRLGGLGHLMETLLSLFAGIPPVIYGLAAIFFAKEFMQPKFAGAGLTDEIIKSLDGLPQLTTSTAAIETILPRWQSTLLGGGLLSLLIIPFMAPLILDAIRNVPNGLREGSIALGATRWFTLLRVTLPSAVHGIIAAISLGILKVMGDVVIVAMAVGYARNYGDFEGMPVPLWDVMEHIPSLSPVGAALAGGLQIAERALCFKFTN